MYPKEKYISTILLNGRTYARTTKYNPVITKDVIKAILNLCTFSSAIQAATLYFSDLRLAIRSCSNASVSICRALSLSILAASTLAASLVNLSHIILMNLMCSTHSSLQHLSSRYFAIFGIRTGFFTAYSHNVTIFLSFGGPSRDLGKISASSFLYRLTGCRELDLKAGQQTHMLGKSFWRLTPFSLGK